jgi:hypothetical protein
MEISRLMNTARDALVVNAAALARAPNLALTCTEAWGTWVSARCRWRALEILMLEGGSRCLAQPMARGCKSFPAFYFDYGLHSLPHPIHEISIIPVVHAETGSVTNFKVEKTDPFAGIVVSAYIPIKNMDYLELANIWRACDGAPASEVYAAYIARIQALRWMFYSNAHDIYICMDARNSRDPDHSFEYSGADNMPIYYPSGFSGRAADDRIRAIFHENRQEVRDYLLSPSLDVVAALPWITGL